MIKVLIADDEPAALRSLRRLVDWETLGFRIEGEAANGEEALAMFRERTFELVITDIRMPCMDGLDLIAGLRERSEVPVIVLSGYGEFEYARRALQLGVADYLLKPIDPEELADKLRAVRARLEAQSAEQKRWHRGLPLMREQLVRRWARGLLGDMSALAEFELIPQGDGLRFAVMMAELARHAASASGSGERDVRGGDAGGGHREGRDRFGRADGIGGAGGASGASGGRSGIEGRGVSGGPGVAGMADGRNGAGGGGGPAGREEHLLRFAVRNVLEESCGGRGLLFEESPTRFGIVYLSSGGDWPAEDMQRKGEALVRNVQSFAKTEISLSIGPAVEPGGVPASYETALMLLDRRNVLSQGERVLTADRVLKGNDSRYMLVEEVKQIVRERYADNLELKGIAAELFVNPVQLGQLFRASTGRTFKEHLLHTRLETAKDLLACTDKRVYEIASEVGFKELDWFYKKFKEYTGRSANGYRDDH